MRLILLVLQASVLRRKVLYDMIANMKRSRKKPKVTFIIPTLNAEQFLPRCLQAIRAQNYPRAGVEIVVVDAFSTDRTRNIAKQYGAKVIDNPEILHEPGKTRGAKKATGDILFYTDADNVLAHRNWINHMVKPYLLEEHVVGFLPQTIPAPDSNPLDRYLGFICTDPFTWFVYEGVTSGRDFERKYRPVKKTKDYTLYMFRLPDPPLFGLSQGAGSRRFFKRGTIGHADDLLAAIKMIKEKGIVAYVPKAGVYHYHVSGIVNFYKKYAWRVRNNLRQFVKGMGVVNRKKFFSRGRQLRMILFIPYGLSLVLPTLDALRLTGKHRDPVLFLHIPASFLLALVILIEYCKAKVFEQKAGRYE